MGRGGWFGLLAVVMMVVGSMAGGTARAEAKDWGWQVVTDPLPYFDEQPRYPAFDSSQPNNKRQNAVPAVTSRGQRPLAEGMDLLVTRGRFPAEDGHLDAVLWLQQGNPTPAGRLVVQVTDAAGNVLADQTIDPIPGHQLFFSPPIPQDLIGQTGLLRVVWETADGQREVARPFAVDQPADVEQTGRIRLHIPNADGATLNGSPVTVGVPFPRGVLADQANVRLVDDAGHEVALQTEVTARWSRFGSIRWLRCHFAADLDGQARSYYLEFGPQVQRSEQSEVELDQQGAGFPRLTTPVFRFDNGLSVSPRRDGQYRPLLDEQALLGAFVEHAWTRGYVSRRLTDGVPHVVPTDVEYEIESHGPVQTTVRHRGWFELPETGDRFCQFDIRYVIHHDSPVVRVDYTWIYTGDSRRDRISNMGWRIPLADAVEPMGFLSSFDDNDWLTGDYLVQLDHDAFSVVDRRRTQQGSRSPGVFAAKADDVRFYVGVRDFWQNYPNELSFGEGEMVVHTWPRHGRQPQHRVQVSDAFRLWFVHEGDLLDFNLPIQMAQGAFYENHSRGEPHWAYARPDSVNAQGIAKTTEMWFYVTDADTPSEQAVRTLAGLNNDSLQAVVDPVWVAGSDAFYDLHPQDENMAEHEKIYSLQTRSPLRQSERMGVYGKWVYGEILRDSDLDEQTIGTTYRIFRKGHWGWPFGWIPFARTGDAEYLRAARAATRMMTDVGFIHYVSDDVREHFASLPPRRMWAAYQPFREVGWSNRNLIPWAGYWGQSTRLYADGGEYLWHAYYMNNDHRARQVLDVWSELTKIESPEKPGRGPLTAAQNRARWPIHLQKQYLNIYEATFDPWFIVAAYAIADMHNHRLETQDWPGHPWNTGPHEFHRYTQSEPHLPFLLNSIQHIAGWRNRGWAGTPSTLIPSVVMAYELTGDRQYLRRAAGLLDLARISTYVEAEPVHYQGQTTRAGVNGDMLFTSWYHRWAPMLMRLIAREGEPTDPIYMTFSQSLTNDQVIAVYKQDGQEIPLAISGNYRITTPAGELVSEGSVDAAALGGSGFSTQAVFDDDDGAEAEHAVAVLPASLPGGVYHVHLGRRTVSMPITAPDTPEVLISPSHQFPRGEGYVQYWFMVPEGVEQFTIEFENPAPFRQSARRITIWDPSGKAQWDYHRLAIDHDPNESIAPTLTVAADQAGQLWRITMPAMRALPFTLDSQLPAMVTHEPNRWFTP